MASLLLYIALVYFTGSVSAAIPHPYAATYLRPEHRSTAMTRKFAEELPLNNYDFEIVPRDQYALAEYDDPRDSLSLFDIIPLPTPITFLATIASKALSVGAWLLSNSGFMLAGAALVVGFCAFTPYCTLVIEKPFVTQIRSLNIPYLDNVEYFFRQAYEKYHK
ncbi:unnamed protein product [Diatraea saccharalis]|uniref:Uncharacterized protein n=1 Tax=Diatraea saccharalis TaxID=40085 RepID=A0A9N9R050_9NEOP|nr:unnamed protein product [Diatraea saccharalis]